MRIERNLGADVIMQFDHVIPGQSDDGDGARRERAEHPLAGAVRRESSDCARARNDARSRTPATARTDPRRSSPSCRAASTPTCGARPRARSATCGDWVGLRHRRAVGRRSEARHVRDARGRATTTLPRDRPRYLMGVGFPEDLVEGVRRGVDLFDCVAPTRMGRNGAAFTQRRAAQHQARRVPHRSAAARRGLRLRGLHAIHPRLHPAPLRRRRDPRAAPALPAQCTFPRPLMRDARDAILARHASTRGAATGSRAITLDRHHPHDTRRHRARPARSAGCAGGGASRSRRSSSSSALIFAIFYFLIIRPQQKQRKKHEAALRNAQARRRDRDRRRHRRRSDAHQARRRRTAAQRVDWRIASRSSPASRGSSSSAAGSRASSARGIGAGVQRQPPSVSILDIRVLGDPILREETTPVDRR